MKPFIKFLSKLWLRKFRYMLHGLLCILTSKQVFTCCSLDNIIFFSILTSWSIASKPERQKDYFTTALKNYHSTENQRAEKTLSFIIIVLLPWLVILIVLIFTSFWISAKILKSHLNPARSIFVYFYTYIPLFLFLWRKKMWKTLNNDFNLWKVCKVPVCW